MGGGETLRNDVPPEDYVNSGHNACPGCGAAHTYRYVLKALGPRTILTVSASCSSAIAGAFPTRALHVPVYHTAFAAAASTASGIRAALDVVGDTETNVVAWAGDGGTFDIGLQSLSAAAERNERIIYVCYDNEAYMMTGIQRSSATPPRTWTMTTPLGLLKDEPKKNIVEIMAAHRVPYAATATTAYPEDLIAKLIEARKAPGMAFIHVLSPCPTGWRLPAELSIKASRLAVQSKFFPLYEVRYGTQYRLTVAPKGVPVREYLRIQGRYSHLSDDDYARAQAEVDAEWEQLLKRVGSS